MPLFLLFLFALALPAQQDGRETFARHCQVCHGEGYGTERGPNLANNRKLRRMNRAEVRELIRRGVPAAGMPAFELPAAELDAVTTLVMGFSAPASGAALPGDARAGEKYFFGDGGCSGCHMVFGKGKAVGPDLSDVGRQMTAEELREALTKPAARLRAGYERATVLLAGGRQVTGFVRNRNRYSLQLQDFGGGFHTLSAGEIASVKQEPPAMPPAACGACRDLLAYLASLAGVEMGRVAHPFESGQSRFEKGDWPTYHGEFGGNRHSPLDQINTSNVARLRLQWLFPINHFVLEVTPLVVNGVMYVTGPNQMWALDARHGRTIWHYQRPRATDVRGDSAKGTNRGAAVLGDRVFMVTDNARLLALHRVTGQLLWEQRLHDDPSNLNYGNTSAPLAVNDMIVAGISGGDLGMRGFLSAYNASTGQRLWRLFTVPKPGEPGSETWKGTALGEFGGGGATWMTGTFDSETNTIFWGTGNPYPAMDGDQRQGDNLYTDSVLAIDAPTGKLKWHYQFTPHDLWDWDGGQTPLVINRTFRGRQRKLLIQANRNGFFYVFDRTNGELLLAEKFVDKLTWAEGIGKDGRPIRIFGVEPTRDGNVACPNVLGAANWPSVAVNPETGWFYAMAREACGIYIKPPGWNTKPIALEPGQMFLRALDIETGKRVWDLPQMGPADSWGGVLSTAGGVIFYGEDSGSFAAADARTPKELWHIQTNASTALGDGHSWRSSPMTYMVAGRQYVAVAAGPNILSFGLED
jgi:PQQ-dependent dehydrogenase (methanol/ethanol family)